MITMTNYEKIKQMSIDEMATAILKGVSNDPCDYCYGSCDICRHKSNIEIVRDWLESEVED